MCDPTLITLLTMRPHPAAHPHYPLIREHPPPGLIHVVINSPPLLTVPPSPYRAIHKMIFLSIPLNCYFLSALYSHAAFSAHVNVWNRLLTKKLFHVRYPPLGSDLHMPDFEGGNPNQMVQEP